MDIFYPIEFFAKWLIGGVFRVASGTLASEALTFFVYDIVKIFLLLFVIIFVVSMLRTFIPRARVREILAGERKGFRVYIGNILAAVLGIITPFCSCSAVPMFLGFLEAGIPLGVTFSFLVASPMINEVALVLLLGMFGWKIALLYVGSGLVIAILSGIVIGGMKMEKLVEAQVYDKDFFEIKIKTWKERLGYAWRHVVGIVGKIWPYVVIGIGAAAWIHGYVPVDFLAQIAGADKWYAVPLATLIGIPLYSNAAGVVPLISALTEKGVALGTVLAFMMAVTALSLPEFMILKRVMKVRLLVIFGTVVGVGIMITGYLFNWVIG